MRRLLLVAFLLLWAGTPAGALTLRPDGPHFEPPRGRPEQTPPFDVPVGPGFETPPSGSPFEVVPPDLSTIGPRPPWQMPPFGLPPFGLRPVGPHRGVPSGVPEPGTALLVGLGLALLGASRRSCRRS